MGTLVATPEEQYQRLLKAAARRLRASECWLDHAVAVIKKARHANGEGEVDALREKAAFYMRVQRQEYEMYLKLRQHAEEIKHGVTGRVA